MTNFFAGSAAFLAPPNFLLPATAAMVRLFKGNRCKTWNGRKAVRTSMLCYNSMDLFWATVSRGKPPFQLDGPN